MTGVLCLALLTAGVSRSGGASEEMTEDQKKEKIHTLFQKASALIKEEHLEEAKHYYLEMVNLDPNFAPAYYFLGIIQIKHDDMEGASRYLEDAIRLGVKDANVSYLLATTYARKGDIDNAKRAYLETIKKNPSMQRAHHDLGVLYYMTGDYDRAVESLKKTVALDPKSAKAMLMLGMACINAGRTEEVAGLVTSLRGLNEEVKAVKLEDLLRQAQAKKKFAEPEKDLLTPGGAPKPTSQKKNSPTSGKGKMSITGNAQFQMGGAPPASPKKKSKSKKSSGVYA